MAAKSGGRKPSPRGQGPKKTNNSSVPMKASNTYNGGNGNPLPAGAVGRYQAAARKAKKK